MNTNLTGIGCLRHSPLDESSLSIGRDNNDFDIRFRQEDIWFETLSGHSNGRAPGYNLPNRYSNVKALLTVSEGDMIFIIGMKAENLAPKGKSSSLKAFGLRHIINCPQQQIALSNNL